MSADLFSTICELKSRGIHFELATYRDGYIMVVASVPGQRWEIEFSSQGVVEIEVFRSDGAISDESRLQDLFQQFSD